MQDILSQHVYSIKIIESYLPKSLKFGVHFTFNGASLISVQTGHFARAQ